MSYEFKLTKGKIMAAAPVESGKRKWEAIGQVVRAEGPSANSSRTRKGWVFNLEADGLGTSYVLKGRGDAKKAGMARAADMLAERKLEPLECVATGDFAVEGEEATLMVEKKTVWEDAPPAEEPSERSVKPEPVNLGALPTGELLKKLEDQAALLCAESFPDCYMSLQVFTEAYIKGYAAQH